jgi:hypothetical protein
MEIAGNSHRKQITLNVNTTTGKSFEIKIDENGLIDELRWQVARKVQTPRDRLTLIHKESVLKTGRLKDHGIMDGSRLTLLPNVESGFSVRSGTQGTEHSVVQAIESLSDQQIDDFLSGRDPLTLALRVEDHMMFIQLQLEQQFKDKSRRSYRHRTQIGHAQPKTTHGLKRETGSTQNRIGKSRTTTSTKPSCPEMNAKSKRNSQDSQRIHSHNSQRMNQLMKSAAERLNPAQPCVILHNQEHKIPTELNELIMATNKNHEHIIETAQKADRVSGDRATSNNFNIPLNGHLPTSTSRLSTNVATTQLSQPTKSQPKPQSQHQTNQSNPAAKMPKTQTERKGLTKEEKAYIDTITSHGQGLFSGTFSGSLHPSIQDYHGKPRRDPQTILQILRDLLSATNQQQFIPQILRGGNGIIVGGHQGRLRTSSTKSNNQTKSTSTSSVTKISKSRVSKAGPSSRSSRSSKSDAKTPKQITPQYGMFKYLLAKYSFV